MKFFIRTLFVLALITPASLVMAHSDHGAINADAAIQIAQKVVQQMTFKDFGYQAGKLDASWKAVTPADIAVEDVDDGFYLVRVSQSEAAKSLVMKIVFNGQVVEVTDTSAK